ncbi:MAG: DUF4249 domain-containing protein [Bacteroidales bacterium]|jgi:hypothetical protein|nr:DUF4249 domain-containing protein [Bacteroidales bacterium]
MKKTAKLHLNRLRNSCRGVIILPVCLTLLAGCMEEYDLITPGDAPPRLVVEGVVTSQPGPYYIRLTESHNGKITPRGQPWVDNLTAVTDALVIVSDNAGQVDTLIPVNASDYRLGGFRLGYDSSGSVYDTVWLQQDPGDFSGNRGFYKTRSLAGIPGRTYSLKIVHRNKTYEASDRMPPVPGIDSLGAAKVITPEGKSDYYAPLLYFAEPQETADYYLIQLIGETEARNDYGQDHYWPFSVLSDEHLQPYVNGLQLNGGTNTIDYEGLPVYWQGDMYVRLNSLSEEAYMYYKALTEQFENDGGIFQPSPASAPTNISAGGLGFFRASAVSEKSLIVNGNMGGDGTVLEVSTAEVTEITATTAVSGMELNFYPHVHLYPFGICWSTKPNPTTDDFVVTISTGYYDEPCKMANLTPGTKYYVRAYAKDRQGMAFYGNQREFTTLPEG